MPDPIIALLEGDGVGPALVAAARDTLHVIGGAVGQRCEIAAFPCGAEYWKAHGEEWPAEAKAFCAKEADAILFGSVGMPGVQLPSGDLAGIGVVFFLRQALDLYANVRPVCLLTDLPGVPYRPSQVRLHLVREATEGLYSRIGGELSRGEDSELAIDVRVVTTRGTERVAAFAFRLAERVSPAGERCHVTCVDKSNVLKGCRVFRRTVHAVAGSFPKVGLKCAYVDNFALDVLRHPQDYSVCVTSNAFGDILADLLAFHEGGTGMAATGNFGESKAMFEPLHGPQAAMKGKGTMNPVAIHRCLAMLLAWLGQKKNVPGFLRASEALEAAIVEVVKGGVRTPDVGGSSGTSEVCQAIRQTFLRNFRLEAGEGARR